MTCFESSCQWIFLQTKNSICAILSLLMSDKYQSTGAFKQMFQIWQVFASQLESAIDFCVLLHEVAGHPLTNTIPEETGRRLRCAWAISSPITVSEHFHSFTLNDDIELKQPKNNAIARVKTYDLRISTYRSATWGYRHGKNNVCILYI